MKKSRLLVAVFICTACISASVSASVVYTYTGNYFDTFVGTAYDESMKVTGTVEYAAPLLGNGVGQFPISYSFTDGLNTITEQSGEQLSFSTDALGNISTWVIILNTYFPSPTNVGDQSFQILSINNPDDNDADEGHFSTCQAIDASGCSRLSERNQTFNTNNPGIWTCEGVGCPPAVPIPPAVWLFGSGLLGLIGIARRKAI